MRVWEILWDEVLGRERKQALDLLVGVPRMAASRSCCAKRTRTPSPPHLRVPTHQTFFLTLLEQRESPRRAGGFRWRLYTI